MVGRPFDTVTNINGCPECQCLCPEIDCDVQCGGEGLGIPGPTDSAGCVTCAGCRVKSKFYRFCIEKILVFFQSHKIKATVYHLLNGK